MRNMSFSMTTDQVRARQKTVTRRLGWWFLKPGDRVRAVKKAMGLKKGEVIEPLDVIEVVSTRAEALDEITDADVAAEGYPGQTAEWFVEKFCKAMSCPRRETVNRIEFRYVDEVRS